MLTLLLPKKAQTPRAPGRGTAWLLATARVRFDGVHGRD